MGKEVYKFDKKYNFIKSYRSVKEATDDNTIARSTIYQYIDSGKPICGNIFVRKRSIKDGSFLTKLKARKVEIECELKKLEDYINHFS